MILDKEATLEAWRSEYAKAYNGMLAAQINSETARRKAERERDELRVELERLRGTWDLRDPA